MRNKFFASALTALIYLSGCTTAINNKHTDSPNVHFVESKGNPVIKEDDFVAVNYTVKTTDGKVVYDNYDHLLFREQSDFKGDLFSSLGMLGEGDSAVVKVSVDSLKARNQAVPAGATGKCLFYYIRVNKVVSRKGEPGRVSDSLLNAAIDNCRANAIESDKKKEDGRLKHYIAQHQLKPIVTASGLQYVITKIGTGPMPKPGDLSQIYFTGKYVDDEVFFTNNKADAVSAGIYQPGKNYVPLDMYIGKRFFIKGLEEGLLLMPQGTKATLLIPSELSNGERYGFVPLICEVEVLNVRQPKHGERIKMLHGDDDEHKETIK